MSENRGVSSVVSWLEFALRVAFFAAAPVVLLGLAMLVPMTAALVNMVLALSAFFFAEVLRGWVEKKGWVGRLLRRQLAFEAYYREQPPKPFVYYVFYPLLFPYWLVQREARREFWLFKGYTLLTFGLVLVAGIYRLFFVYRPELGVRDFVGPFFLGLLIETFAVMMLIMPITTSVVALHIRKQDKRLVALIVVGLLSSGVTAWGLAHRHRTTPSLEARNRVEQRTKARPTYAEHAMVTGLLAAWARKDEGTRAKGEGILEGPPLDAARGALGEFYRADEAASFDLWASGKKDAPMLVLFAEGRSKKSKPVFLGMKPDGTVVRKGAELPPGARKIVRDTSPL